MGEGGRITLINEQNRAWILVNESSYQMSHWSFPQRIEAHSYVHVYIEFQQKAFKYTCDDSGNAEYEIEGSSERFQVQARAMNGFTLQIELTNMSTWGSPKGILKKLGWKHDGYVSFLMTTVDSNITYSSIDDDCPTWMQNSFNMLGDRRLKRICIPGSHDAGMSCIDNSTVFGGIEGLVITQSESIGGQLYSGARYFDIRPVIAGGRYKTGHYNNSSGASDGANGQSIESIISEINQFMKNKRELIVLNLSHSLNTDLGFGSYRTFNQTEWNGLFSLLSGLEHRFVHTNLNVDLSELTLKEFISEHSSVVIIVEDDDADRPVGLGAYHGNGFYKYSSFNVYNQYSNTDEFSVMYRDQLNKMKNFYDNSSIHDKYSMFLLSWTLTPNGPLDKIIGPANNANNLLTGYTYPTVKNSSVDPSSRLLYPNIVYIDNVIDGKAAVLSMAINNVLR